MRSHYLYLNRFKFLSLSLILLSLVFSDINANSDEIKLKKLNWPFDGVLGKLDRQAAQRGFQVYKEVCAACHGLQHLYYRNLIQLGFSEAEIKELAKNYTVKDGPNDEGEMFDRSAILSDHFVKPFPNDQAAKAANNGAAPPDLSLIIKTRENGANYVYSILNGYVDPPNNFILMPGLHYNKYFPNFQIAMPKPLNGGEVTFADGTLSSVEQMSRDIVIFLQWAAEPEMEQRKSMGFKVVIFLIFFIYLFYLSKKRIWSNLDSSVNGK